MADSLIPDAGEAWRAFAATRPAITALVDDRNSLALSGDEPAIRYALVSGRYDGAGVAAPLLQIECWGAGGGVEDDGTAWNIAAAVVSVAPEIVGGVFAGARVAGVRVSHPFWSPDPVTNRPRYIVELRLLDHAPTT